MDLSNPWRLMPMDTLKENGKIAFRKKTGIVIFKIGGLAVTPDDFVMTVHCAAGSFRVGIIFDKGEWEITKR